MRSRYAALLISCLALAAAVMAPLGARGGRADVILLKKVAASVTPQAGVIVIEASDPVPYIASQPDPRTFVIELREVVAIGFADSVRVEPGHPMADVRVESGTGPDGVNVARIRMTLTRAQRPRVRSARNVIYVEADRAEAPLATRADAPAASASSSAATSAMAALRPVTTAVPPPAPPDAVPGANPRPAQAAAVAAQVGPFQAAAQLAPVAPQQPTPTPPTLTQPAAPGRYTGEPVSLDFQGADLRAVLRTFSEISGLNIVIDPAVQGTVDVSLRDVPWDQALEVILRANKLDYVADGTIVRVAPIAVLRAEQDERRALADAAALGGTLETMTRALSYAKANDDLTTLLTDTVLSQRGNARLDARTNTLIITDLPERLERVSALLKTLDQPEPQVEIEARIVQTTRDFARAIGVQWGIGARAAAELGNTIPLAFPNQGSITGRTGAGPQGPGAPNPGTGAVANAVNLGAGGASSAIGLALGSVNGAINLDVALSALEGQGQGRILSTPRVSTQNNVAAEITQGIQIPIQTVANNTVTVTFKDAALTLRVTPQITVSNTVIMQIALENAAADFSRAVNNIPPINTQRAVTQVLVNDGDTTVIGGIYMSEEQARTDRTPGLHRLPLLGWLFRRDRIDDASRELLIFITPRINRL